MIQEGSYSQFYPNATNWMRFTTTDMQTLAELEFGLIWGPYDNCTAPKIKQHPQMGLEFILG